MEVSGILKALASNLLKVSGDIRLLSSGPDAGVGEIRIPARQAGSSIMPGKVNPVIPEAVSQAAIVVMANDMQITQAASMGSLELNPFLPIIADALLGSLELLTNACSIFRRLCVAGMEAGRGALPKKRGERDGERYGARGRDRLRKAQEVAAEAARTGKSVRQAAVDMGILAGERFDELVSPENVMRLGAPLPPREGAV